ncbi:MAG: metallophosphoesterase [Verrucomicrobiota bacterium]
MTILSRRKWINGLFMAGAGAFGYGTFYERLNPRVEYSRVPLLPEHKHLHGTKIALLADFHFDDYPSDGLINYAIEKINREKVDIVMLAGDFISDNASALQPLADLLTGLDSRYGTFGVLGNHDHKVDPLMAAQTLETGNIRILENEFVSLPNDLTILGMDSAWRGDPYIEKTLPTCPANTPIIMGWHEPDTFDWHFDSRVVLQLSGHTHGGQVCAPFKGPITLPFLGKQYCEGLYRSKTHPHHSSHLYVTRGIGVLTIPTRFMCPPEIAILELKAA